jgi:hypothetical protein
MSDRSTQSKSAESPIPQIDCPQCGRRMRLATLEPEGGDNHDSLSFDCECGFEYRVTDDGLLPSGTPKVA